MTPDPKAVARGLTKAQRRIVCEIAAKPRRPGTIHAVPRVTLIHTVPLLVHERDERGTIRLALNPFGRSVAEELAKMEAGR